MEEDFVSGTIGFTDSYSQNSRIHQQNNQNQQKTIKNSNVHLFLEESHNLLDENTKENLFLPF